MNDFSKIKLEYSKEILSGIHNDYSVLDNIVEKMQIKYEDFFKNLVDFDNNNIDFYDQVLCIINDTKKLKKVKNDKNT